MAFGLLIGEVQKHMSVNSNHEGNNERKADRSFGRKRPNISIRSLERRISRVNGTIGQALCKTANIIEQMKIVCLIFVDLLGHVCMSFLNLILRGYVWAD